MPEVLHLPLARRIPIYGMNRGSVGFLMNDFEAADLIPSLTSTARPALHPPTMTAVDAPGHP